MKTVRIVPTEHATGRQIEIVDPNGLLHSGWRSI